MSNSSAENKFKIGDVVRYTGTASYVNARWQKSTVYHLDNRRVYTWVNGHSTWFYYHDLELVQPTFSNKFGKSFQIEFNIFKPSAK